MTIGIIGLVLCGVATALTLTLKSESLEEKPEEFLSDEEEQAVLLLREKQAKEEGKFSSLFWEGQEKELKKKIRAKRTWNDLMEELRSYE